LFPAVEEVFVATGTRIAQGLILLGFLLLGLFFVYLLIGRYNISPGIGLEVLVSRLLPIETSWPPVVNTVMWDVRVPRALAVALVGGGLALSGAAFQGTLRNPLVSEHILGVSSGAGFGAAVAILLGADLYVLQLSAFACGILAVLMVYFISRMYTRNPTLVLVLAGIIVSGLFSALTSLIKYIADPMDKLPVIVFWLMGSFAKTAMKDVYLTAPVILICSAVLLLIRWRFNVLSMGDEEARALGINVRRLTLIIIGCCTLITASAVCISGTIGWVGLVVPHIARMIFGPDHRYVLPASCLIGASYLLLVDLFCRNIAAAEIPVSIVTSIIGAPVFLYLLKQNNARWS
jgi:iron complex transport system permease protein